MQTTFTVTVTHPDGKGSVSLWQGHPERLQRILSRAHAVPGVSFEVTGGESKCTEHNWSEWSFEVSPTGRRVCQRCGKVDID